jgi:pSer/pThr/pTyr-binding forkhead associated (FHA) protein/uncharacterized protein involved in exopolysaccharide biosynthesis
MSAHSNTISGSPPEDSAALTGFSGSDTVGDASPDVVATASLVVVDGASKGRVYALIKPFTTIGRARNADITISSQSISQQHARIELRGKQHVLVDLASTNGTILNGKALRANEPVVLQEGDAISFADLSLIYLKTNNSDNQDVTQALQRVGTNSLVVAPALQSLDLSSLIQLLQHEPAPAPQQPSANIDDLIEKVYAALQVAKRHALLGFVLAATSALAGVGSMAVVPPLAEATCLVAIRPEANKNPLTPEERAQSAASAAQTAATAAQDFVSDVMVTATLKELNHREPTSDEIKTTIKHLKFESMALSVYGATYKARDSKHAVTFLERHLKNYLEAEVTKMLTVERSKVDFLTNQVRDNEVQLESMEKKLQEFKQKNLEGLPEYAREHITSREELITKQSDLRAQLDKTNLELSEARRRLADMRFIPETTNKEADPYRQSLVEVNRKLSEARAKGLGEEHPDVLALNDQAKRLQALVKEAQNRKLSGVELQANEGLTTQQHKVADLVVGAKSIEAELGQVGGLVGRLNDIVKKMPDVEAKYAELSRSYEVSKTLQAQLYQKLRSSEIQLAFSRASAAAQFEVPIPPQSYGVPIRRVLATRAGIGAAIGLVLGILVALFKEARHYLAGLPKRQAQRLADLGKHPMLPG